MSDTNRVAVRLMPEVTWGVVPATALQNVRITGESLKFAIANIVSEEMRSDRQVTDLIQTSKEGQGGFNFELSYNNLDTLFPGIFMSAWSAQRTITAGTISAAAADNSINDSGAGFPVFVPGEWIKIAGFTGTVANNGFAKVVSRTTSKIVVSGLTLVNDAAGESVTVNAYYMRNGTTEKSFVIEKEFQDLTNIFHTFTGMEVQNFNLALTAQAIAKGSVTFLGNTMTVGSATAGTGAHVAAPTLDVMNCMTNVAALYENGSLIASPVFVRDLELSLTNNLRGRPAIGVVGHSSLGRGRVGVTGKITTYFQNGTLYDKFINGTATSMSFQMTDAAGNTYIFDLPRLKFVDGTVVAGSSDADVLADITFQAIMDTTNSYTIQISKFS